MKRALAIAALALGLAACHDKQADTGKTAAAAEVLPGSASDAMIAYDTLKSQPPRAVATEPAAEGASRPGRSADAARGTDGAVPDEAAASDVAAEPAAADSGAPQ